MMKKALLVLLTMLLVLVIAGVGFLKLPVFGAHPEEDDVARFSASENYNVEKRRFENRQANLIDEMRANSSTSEMLREWFRDRADGVPSAPLPEVRPDLERFMADDGGNRVIWFGHSSFLLNLSGQTILVDPVFSETAAPVSFTARRFQPPVLSLDELPSIDIILISHDHYDHLDKSAIEHFQDEPTEFVMPLGVGMHLQRWGIDASRITERDWWESYQTGDITFVAAPAQHFSGRDGINNNETLWASWALMTEDVRLFFSGDSGYDQHFQEIGERLGPFDMAFMENGQYDESWRAVHLLPEETATAFEELNARRLFPVHWGMFQLAFHTWYDPIVSLAEIATKRQLELATPTIGEVLDIDQQIPTTPWWEALIGDQS